MPTALAANKVLRELIDRDIEAAAAALQAEAVEGAVGAGLADEVGGVALLDLVISVVVSAPEEVVEVRRVLLLDPALAPYELERYLVDRDLECAAPVGPAGPVGRPVCAGVAFY